VEHICFFILFRLESNLHLSTLKENDNERKYSLLTSPIPGPPNTLISSLELPPLSDIGMILHFISLSLSHIDLSISSTH
jgi:hypothetical protein